MANKSSGVARVRHPRTQADMGLATWPTDWLRRRPTIRIHNTTQTLR